MYLVRDVFKAKPGEAKRLVEIFQEASPHLLDHGAKNIRILTDVVSNFWTVVWEFEIEEINEYFEMSKNVASNSKVFNSLEGYKDYILEGHREVFRIE